MPPPSTWSLPAPAWTITVLWATPGRLPPIWIVSAAPKPCTIMVSKPEAEFVSPSRAIAILLGSPAVSAKAMLLRPLPPVMMRVSLPGPPCRVSEPCPVLIWTMSSPSPACTISLPGPGKTVSLPAPALTKSLPAPALTLSLPPRAWIVSLPAPDERLSAPGVPNMVGSLEGIPGGPVSSPVPVLLRAASCTPLSGSGPKPPGGGAPPPGGPKPSPPLSPPPSPPSSGPSPPPGSFVVAALKSGALKLLPLLDWPGAPAASMGSPWSSPLWSSGPSSPAGWLMAPGVTTLSWILF